MAWRNPYCPNSKKGYLLPIALFSFVLSFAQTIFQPTDAPASLLNNDGQPIVFGVKFRATQNGYITGIRYYKGSGTTGTHTAQLWSATGTLIETATFANESSSGWQQILFTTPAPVTAGITYVASCHSSSGDYAYTNPYFSQPVINGPLRALASGEEGLNGVYAYSSNPSFPSNGFQSINYWVDVIFSLTNGPDVDPPVVSAITPANGTSGVSTTTSISAVFNEAIDPASVTTGNFQLRHPNGSIVTATVSYDAGNNTVLLVPASSLQTNTNYTAILKGGSAGITDIAGNSLVNDYTWSFTSNSLLAPTEGYGGPILVVSSSDNRFSRYTVEILRAEGLNEFAAKDISSITATELAAYDVVVLGEMDIAQAQVEMFSAWVNAGGTLVSFKPGTNLSPLFGINAATGTLSDKYLLVHTASGPGAGIVNETIQFHGAANLHTLNGATSLATLYSDANTMTGNPAVTSMNVGTNGGKAIAFTYDLAKSIIYTRQGNPAWAGQERDGELPIRSDDLFFGTPPNTGADWIDFNKVAIPQADEQQRLLANIIIQGNLHRKPLPRLWYLPRRLKAAVVMTGDDHAHNGTEGRFNHYKTLGPNTPGDVADWNAVRGTSYIYPNTPIGNAQAVALEAEGFEIALHPSTGCGNYTAASLNNNITSQLSQLSSGFPGLSKPVTNRTHCLVWSDWATHAKVEAANGMRLDVNYYYWPGSWVQNRPGMFTGSGMPMRLADTDGSLIDCYQVTTQMTDESGIDFAGFSEALFDKAIGPEGFYGTFCANMHTDSINHIGSSTIIASALARKIPVISSKQLLTWLDGRNNSYFESINWNNNQLQFTLTAPAGARNLSGMLPRYIGNMQLTSVTRSGVSVWANAEMIKGMEYVFFDVAIGGHQYLATYASTPVVTQHPAPITVCVGEALTFHSSATGSPLPAVQWQQSLNGTTWNNINGANAASYSFIPSAADNNKLFRAAWSNSSGSANSNSATLTVKPLPALTSTLTPGAVVSGTPFNYNPIGTVSGINFAWSRAAITGISNASATGSGDIEEILHNTTTSQIVVTYVYKMDVNGCFNSQQVKVRVDPAPQGCLMSTAITANFNGTTIKAGRYIWFSSLFKAKGLGGSDVNFYVTNSKITYVLNNQQVTLNVPSSQIRFSASVGSATTEFSGGKWVTVVPMNYTGNVFLTGLSHYVTSQIPGGLRNITWFADIEADRQGVSLEWKWTAGVYTNFGGHSGLNVKPTDGILNILNPLLNLASAGTPQNYTLSIVAGAMGSGLLNITNTYTSKKKEMCSNPTPGDVIFITGPALPGQKQVAADGLSVIATPNPSHTTFRLAIAGKGDQKVSVRVLDMYGKQVFQRSKVNLNSSLQVGENWAAGTYFAEVILGEEKKIIKVVKLN